MKRLNDLFTLAIVNFDFAEWIKKYYLIVIIVLVVVIGIVVTVVCIKKKKRKREIEEGYISKYIDPEDIATAKDLEHIKTKALTEKVEMYKGYCRYQEDNQEVIKRSDEQQKIFDEYFVVKNLRTITCEVKHRKKADLFNLLEIIGFILGVCLVLVGLFVVLFVLLGIAFIVLGIVFLVLKKVFLKKFNESLEQTDGPEKLINSEEYEALVSNKIESMDMLNLGIKKLGVEEIDSENIDSIIIRDKVLNDKSLYVYDNNLVHSSTQFVSLFIFLKKKLYVYKVQFDMCNNMKEECIHEFDYKDICDCSLYTKRVIKETYENKKIEFDVSIFKIVTLNSEVNFKIYDENLVSELRKKIREKNN